MSRTIYVYPSKDGWTVKKEGRAGAFFPTKTAAIARALAIAKRLKHVQISVLQADGRFVPVLRRGLREVAPAHGTPSVAPELIERAVSQVILKRLATL
jgi:hypothetical protein